MNNPSKSATQPNETLGMQTIRRAKGLRHRGKYLVLDVLTLTGFFVVTVTILWMIHEGFSRQFAYSALVGVLGLVMGAVVAVVITPFTIEERAQWSNMTSAIVGVAAGYGISIVDDSISYLFKDARVFTDALLGVRVATFLVCFFLTLVYGFSYRRYYVTLDLFMDNQETDSRKKKIKRRPIWKMRT